jgi:hypothetical protein
MDQQLQMTFILLIVYQVKHYVADFPLQREYMLRKTLPHWDFLLPLMTHCAVHGLLTLAICLVWGPHLWWLALFDFVVHFITDRVKSGPRYLGRFNDLTQAGFWNVLGLDQMVHHLTHIVIIYVLVTH